jgi:phage/plasmid-associated DNA primase
MELYCQEQGVGYGALCFDGMMPYRKDVKDIHELLKGMEERLLEKFGYPIGLSVKEMDQPIDISDLKPKDDIKTTDEDYALFLLDALKDDILYDFYNKETFFWNEANGLWLEQKVKHLRTYISRVLIPYVETSPDPEVIAEQSFFLKQDSKQSAIVRMCEPYIEQRRDDAFISARFNRSKGLFPIADKKVINLRTSEVRDRKREDYFTKTTERKLQQLTPERRQFILDYFAQVLSKPIKEEEKKEETAEEAVGDLVNDLIAEVAQDKPVPAIIKHRDCLLYFCAYITTGENHLKLFGNFIGEKDAGKSLFLELLCEMLGEFGGWANARLFVEQKNASCHDSELFNLRGKRMSGLSETSSKQKYNEDLIKKISGGDKVNIRGAGEKKTIDELFQTVLLLATNNVCQFSDPAFMSRLMCFNFCNSFKRDASVKEKMFKLIDDFFTVICEYAKMFYEKDRQIEWSDEVKSYTAQVCEEQDTIKVWCRDQVTFTKYNRADATHNKEEFFVEKTGLFERYKDHWSGSGRKYEGKIIFYREFEKLFGLEPAKKVRRDMGTVWCYEGLKENE